MNGDTRSGKVYLVGAGPGDPQLITLRGVECLQQADLVISDYLVNTDILIHAPASAERIYLEHHGKSGGMSAESVIKTMVDEARRGKTVVRLQNGDPAVFGRLAEEITALYEAAIPFEIVPGVTAGLAAAGCAAIPVTHGLHSSAVALVTGHERADKSKPGLDYAALAKFPGTLIFYMGISSISAWSEALMSEGKSAATPVAIVRRCSWPDQKTTLCTLGTLAETVLSRSIRPPAVIVVGEVVDFVNKE